MPHSHLQEHGLNRGFVRPAAESGQESGVPGMGGPPLLIHEPALSLVQGLQSSATLTEEKMFRIQPDDGWFDPAVSRTNPVKIFFGSYNVPKHRAYLLFDYRFAAFVLSGVSPGGFEAAEPGQFSNQMGFDVQVGGGHFADISYQLEPVPAPREVQQFSSGSTAPLPTFAQVGTHSFASASGLGTTMLPLEDKRMGPRQGPFTVVAQPGSTVSLVGVIFSPIEEPLGCLEGRVMGYGIEYTLLQSLLERTRLR